MKNALLLFVATLFFSCGTKPIQVNPEPVSQVIPLDDSQVEVLEMEKDDSGDTYRAYQVRMVDAGKNTRAVVKLVRKVTGLGLKEAKELATRGGTLLKNLNKKAAYNFANQLRELGAQVEVLEMEKDDPGDTYRAYEVRLIDAGKNTRAVVKLVRKVTGLGLKEAQELATRGGTLLKNLNKKAAGNFANQLRELGAQVEIVE